MKPYKHANGRVVFRKSNGRFRQATLKDFGVPDSALSDGNLKACELCGYECRPILKAWRCHKCDHKQGGES